MRAFLPTVLFCLAITAHAKEWKNEIFHCAATIPEGNGWQMIDAPPTPGIAPVLVMQNNTRQLVFGINVVEKFRNVNLTDPAIQGELEAMLRQFGYQFVGHANVTVAGINWLQYPVHTSPGPQQVSGLIRYASMGGYVYSISMLRGGSQQAAQDSELLQTAASFRILPAVTAGADGTSTHAKPGTPPRNTASPKTAAVPEEPTAEKDAATEEDNSKARMIWAGAAGLVVLVLFLGIITKKPVK